MASSVSDKQEPSKGDTVTHVPNYNRLPIPAGFGWFNLCGQMAQRGRQGPPAPTSP